MRVNRKLYRAPVGEREHMAGRQPATTAQLLANAGRFAGHMQRVDGGRPGGRLALAWWCGERWELRRAHRHLAAAVGVADVCGDAIASATSRMELAGTLIVG